MSQYLSERLLDAFADARDPGTRKGPPRVPTKYAPYKQLSIRQTLKAIAVENKGTMRAFTVKNLESLRYIAPHNFVGADIEHTTYNYLGHEKFFYGDKNGPPIPYADDNIFRRAMRERLAPFVQQGDAGPLAGILQRYQTHKAPHPNIFPTAEQLFGEDEDYEAMGDLFSSEFREYTSASKSKPITIRMTFRDWWHNLSDKEIAKSREQLPRHTAIALFTVLMHANSATGFRGIMVAAKWAMRKLFPWAKARARPRHDASGDPIPGTGPTQPLSPRNGWTYALVRRVYGSSGAYPRGNKSYDYESRNEREHRLFSRYEMSNEVEKLRDLAEALLFILSTLATWNPEYASISGLCTMDPLPAASADGPALRRLAEHTHGLEDYPEHQSRIHLESMYDVAALARYSTVAIRYSHMIGSSPKEMQDLLLKLDPLASMHSRSRPPGWCPWAASQAMIQAARSNEKLKSKLNHKHYPSILEHLSERVRRLQIFHNWHFDDWIISTYRTHVDEHGIVQDGVDIHRNYPRGPNERSIDADWLSADMPHGMMFFDTVWMLHPLSHNFSVFSAEVDAREHLLVELQYFALMMMAAYGPAEYRGKLDLKEYTSCLYERYDYDGPAVYSPTPSPPAKRSRFYFPEVYEPRTYYRLMSCLLRDKIVEAHQDKNIRTGRHLTRCVMMMEWRRPGRYYAYREIDLPPHAHEPPEERSDCPYGLAISDSSQLFSIDPCDKGTRYIPPWWSKIRDTLPWDKKYVNDAIEVPNPVRRAPLMPSVAAEPAPLIIRPKAGHLPELPSKARADDTWIDHYMYAHGQLLPVGADVRHIADYADPEEFYMKESNRTRYFHVRL